MGIMEKLSWACCETLGTYREPCRCKRLAALQRFRPTGLFLPSTLLRRYRGEDRLKLVVML